MTEIYQTRGTCARRIHVTIDENGILTDVSFEGGCNGNLKGIATLVIGRPAKEVAELLEGIDCNRKGTSCPDQLSKAIRKMLG